jgi:hypothetical protein
MAAVGIPQHLHATTEKRVTLTQSKDLRDCVSEKEWPVSPPLEFRLLVFNPVSALFRSKRWKTCSNYPLLTSKLKASKDLQRFARLATTPRFKIDFNDERSMTACIESLELFAHFALVSKHDDLGQLQPAPFAREQDSTEGFFGPDWPISEHNEQCGCLGVPN